MESLELSHGQPWPDILLKTHLYFFTFLPHFKMPKNRKAQVAAPKKPRTGELPVEVEDEILASETTGVGPSTSGTYVVSEAETASGASSVDEDSFITPLPVPVDAANLLFNPPAGSIHPDMIRVRTDQLRERVEQTCQAALQGINPRPDTPPRPGTQTETLSAAQLQQIREYLQNQEIPAEDRATQSRAPAPTTPPQPGTAAPAKLFTLPLLPTYRSAFINHFEGVTSKILKLSPTKYIVLYLAIYNQRCPLNCGKTPIKPEDYREHLVAVHPSALLLQCPAFGCGSSFFGAH